MPWPVLPVECNGAKHVSENDTGFEFELNAVLRIVDAALPTVHEFSPLTIEMREQRRDDFLIL